METKLNLKVKRNFGRALYYPTCPASRALTRLAKKETFTESDLELLREIGFEFNFLPDLPESAEALSLKGN